LGGQYEGETLAQDGEFGFVPGLVVGGGDVGAEDDLVAAFVCLPGGGAQQ
jgi:hypothetical protein